MDGAAAGSFGTAWWQAEASKKTALRCAYSGLYLNVPASAMAAQFKQLVLDEFKPVVLVTASAAASAALGRNNLTFDQVFAPHAEAALPPLPLAAKEGSAFGKLEGTMSVRYVDVGLYNESEADAEASLVKALTQHNNVSRPLGCSLCRIMFTRYSAGVGPFPPLVLQP
jgi:hypothetical protein